MITLKDSNLPIEEYVDLVANTLRGLVEKDLLSNGITTMRVFGNINLDHSWEIFGRSSRYYNFGFKICIDEATSEVTVYATHLVTGSSTNGSNLVTFPLSSFKEDFDMDVFFKFFDEAIEVLLTEE